MVVHHQDSPVLDKALNRLEPEQDVFGIRLIALDIATDIPPITDGAEQGDAVPPLGL